MFAIVICLVLLMCTLKFCVVCNNGRRYVCCGECYVVSDECDEPTSCLVQPIIAHCCEVMYFGCFDFRGELGFLNCDDICMCVVNKQFELQTTQLTSGGAVTANSSCCAHCVEPPRPQQWGPDLPFFGHAGHADPLDGWRCCSQKRVMSRPIQVRQL